MARDLRGRLGDWVDRESNVALFEWAGQGRFFLGETTEIFGDLVGDVCGGVDMGRG